MNLFLRNWLFPTLTFFCFLYVLFFIGLYTYKININQALFTDTSKKTTNLKSFGAEMKEALGK